MSGSTSIFFAYTASLTNEVMNYGTMGADAYANSTAAGLTEITGDQYTLLTQGGRYMLNDGTLVAIPEAPPLSEAIIAASAMIDVQAEAARRLFITPGTGMSMVYQMKSQEASAFLAAYPTEAAAAGAEAAAWPFIANEMGLTAETLWGVADSFNNARLIWQNAAVLIEKIRLQAKASVAAATTTAEITAASSIVWPTNPLTQINTAAGAIGWGPVSFGGTVTFAAVSAAADVTLGAVAISGSG